ncbi:hypothetical protein [Cryobacterium sp. PH31-O1]|uniref:PepSY domain-containing protein n=1 Tax=Cryobacterium sp. PH31-O1 TaxID=3046306 RepID=UPI0024BBB67F|nr:hypothetical protein [Cryobacterium sp. PH31-O1]MDJ0338036.1 hypothetical protein [Cryobacterium sp. PH31-O1]
MNKKNIFIATAVGVVLVLGGAGIALAVSDMGDNDGPLSGETLDRASNAALADVGPGTVTSAERNDDGGSAYDLEVRLDDGTTVDVELNDSFDVVWVGDYDNDDSTSNSSAAPSATSSATADTSAADQAATERASAEAAALAAVGSGRVTDFDRDDDWDHLYEVEVTLDDGSDRDVDLDANFVVVSIDDVQQ